MRILKLAICSILIINQFSVSSCALSQAWDRFMEVSCDFSSDVEKFLPSGGQRFKRSTFRHEEPNFDDPEQLFEYLYPLAHIKKEDILMEAQRSSNSFQSNPIYGWITEIGSIWITQCKKRAGNEDSNYDGDEMPHSTKTKTEGSENRTNSERMPSRLRQRRNVSHSGQRSILTSQNLTRLKVKGRHGLVDTLERKLNLNATTTEAPVTTTTADPGASDDNFFASYGGDIEYFFPLISFGIPFDGEITFLGFHGFKGLFPY